MQGGQDPRGESSSDDASSERRRPENIVHHTANTSSASAPSASRTNSHMPDLRPSTSIADEPASESGDVTQDLSRRDWLAWGLGAGASALSACASGPPAQVSVADIQRVNSAQSPPTAPTVASPSPPAGADAPPEPPREFRAAWVATVAHIDWPSRRGLSASAQREEIEALVERAAQIGLNALILQVRPSGDALYPSELEPWSEWLTGRCGQAPDTAWDPLQTWIDIAHRRGLELHAWFNPYRVRHSAARTPAAGTHVALNDPSIVRSYGNQLWMDPGEPRSAQRVLAAVSEVVSRYDIDGVHLDDYFYPYPLKDDQGRTIAFPDDDSWRRAQTGPGDDRAGPDRAAWRRSQVDRLVQSLFERTRQLKPWLLFGISPFGLPRPDRRPPGIMGFSAYDQLHADAEHWLAKGWLDYVAPQLYWPRDQAAQAFDVLLEAWRRDNPQGRHIWPGLYSSKVVGLAGTPAWPAQEILDQLRSIRQHGAQDANLRGHLHFSLKALLDDRLGPILQTQAYAATALPPTSPWRAVTPPLAPRVAWRDIKTLQWQADARSPGWRGAVLQWLTEEGWSHRIVPAQGQWTLPTNTRRMIVRSLGRDGTLSAGVSLTPDSAPAAR